MGIKGLFPFLQQHTPRAIKQAKIQQLAGKTVALDTSIVSYQFLSQQQRINKNNEVTQLKDQEGNLTSHLLGIFYRSLFLLQNKVKPVWVIDGDPPENKAYEVFIVNFVQLEQRSNRKSQNMIKLSQAQQDENVKDELKFTQRTIFITEKMKKDTIQLIQLMGLPMVLAPCEAEAQCVGLAKQNLVDFVASEDMDCLAFGSNFFILFCGLIFQKKNFRWIIILSNSKYSQFKLTVNINNNIDFNIQNDQLAFINQFLGCPILLKGLKNSDDETIVQIHIETVLEQLDFDMDQFIDFCILCGCDYTAKIKNIGNQMAFKLIKEHKSIEQILLKVNRLQLHDEFDFIEARNQFQYHVIQRPNELTSQQFDRIKIENFLIKEKGFQESRLIKKLDLLEQIQTEQKS